LISEQLKEKIIKDLQDRFEAQKQLLESEKERLAAHLSVTEREKREKESLIAKIQQENLQLRESVNQHLT